MSILGEEEAPKKEEEKAREKSYKVIYFCSIVYPKSCDLGTAE